MHIFGLLQYRDAMRNGTMETRAQVLMASLGCTLTFRQDKECNGFVCTIKRKVDGRKSVIVVGEGLSMVDALWRALAHIELREFNYDWSK